MRRRTPQNPPCIRGSFALLALLIPLALIGCGGGGGAAPAPTTTVTGKVVSSTDMSPIPAATVTIVGTNLSAQTQADGTFSIANVPAAATRFVVTSPDLTKYLSIAYYAPQGASLQEYATDPNTGSQCTLPLPTLHGGTVALPAAVELASAANVPPLPTGCP